MARFNSESFSNAVKLLQGELEIVVMTLREKGLNRFLRPLAMGGVLVYATYAFVYEPPAKKLAALQKRINTAKTTAQYADNFKNLRGRLSDVYGLLPSIKQRGDWLTNVLIDSMKAENIIADSLVPPEESEETGFVFQKTTVSVSLKFSELVSWLNRLEGNKPLLHVITVDIAKHPQPLGSNGVNCTIGTLIPAKRLGQ